MSGFEGMSGVAAGSGGSEDGTRDDGSIWVDLQDLALDTTIEDRRLSTAGEDRFQQRMDGNDGTSSWGYLG